MTSVLMSARVWSEALSTASSFLSVHSSSVSFPLTNSMLESEGTAAETKRVSGCLQGELTSEAFELGREEGTGEEMEGEEEEALDGGKVRGGQFSCWAVSGGCGGVGGGGGGGMFSLPTTLSSFCSPHPCPFSC